MKKLMKQPSYTMSLSDLEDLTKKISGGADTINIDREDANDMLYDIVEELEIIRTNLLDNSFLGAMRRVGKNRHV